MSRLKTYKDVLVHPNSELAKLLEAGETKKAEELYRKVTREANERGETDPKCHRCGLTLQKCMAQRYGDPEPIV